MSSLTLLSPSSPLAQGFGSFLPLSLPQLQVMLLWPCRMPSGDHEFFQGVGGDGPVVLGPMRGCWSLQPCLAGPICYSSEQTSASADAGHTSPLHRLTDGNHWGARPSPKGIPTARWEIAGPRACSVLAHMAQSVVYADLRFAKVMGGRSMASQALEAGESPWDAPCCPQHAQPRGLSFSPLPCSNSPWNG